MAHLWMREGDANEWRVLPLVADPLDLTDERPRLMGPSVAGRVQVMVLPLQTSDDPGISRYLLIAHRGAAVRVNGLPIPGAKVLADRDEIRIGKRPPVYFAIRSLPTVTRFQPLASHVLECPRCGGVIDPDDTVVSCPNCRVVHHQIEEKKLGCWTYAAECASCRFPTALDADYPWVPEED